MNKIRKIVLFFFKVMISSYNNLDFDSITEVPNVQEGSRRIRLTSELFIWLKYFNV